MPKGGSEKEGGSLRQRRQGSRRSRSREGLSNVSGTDGSQLGKEKEKDHAGATSPDSGALEEGPYVEPLEDVSRRAWHCLDSCCWLLGNTVVLYWIVVTVWHALTPQQIQIVKEAITGPLPDPPGKVLAAEGLRMRHPVVFVPGIVTGGLELWEGKECAEGLFRKRLWGGTFGEVYKRPFCWMEHMILDNETGLDPPGVRVRPVSGLVAADYFAPGYFVWAMLIEALAQIGYEERSMYMAAYDWRLSFQNTEVRDRSMSRLKSTIETLKATNGGHKVVVVAHSMGSLYFLHFLKWVEAAAPQGGGGGPTWVADHVHTVANIGGPFLGVPKAFTGLFSAEAKDVAVARASLLVDLLGADGPAGQTLQHVLRVTRTWDSILSMFPKGGDAIWGGLDWAPEDGSECHFQPASVPGAEPGMPAVKTGASGGPKKSPSKAAGAGKKAGASAMPTYGRMLVFGDDAVTAPLKEILTAKAGKHLEKALAAAPARPPSPPPPATPPNASEPPPPPPCGDAWTEYAELPPGIPAAVEAGRAYSAGGLLGLLRAVAPRAAARWDGIWSHGLAEGDPRAPRYDHPRFWSNALETSLPDAPNMEVFCMYGVGIPTERAYVYQTSSSNTTAPSSSSRSLPFPFSLFRRRAASANRTSAAPPPPPPPASCNIPFQIDPHAHGDPEATPCLHHGVQFVDGDETVPVLSAGLTCAKAWKGKTRFNPSGARTFNLEYQHVPPKNLLEGRGPLSGSHVDIMGNSQLIEDLMRIAAGASGKDLGGDRVHSDLAKWAERVKLKL